MRTIYFIPIRSGSKGVPGKNMKLLGGKPLVAWVLDTITASRTADDIWVATDSDEAEQYIRHSRPHVKVYRRSPASAADSSKVIDVVLEFIEAEQLNSDDILVLAQATSPFTLSADFIALKNAVDNREADSYIACRRSKSFIWHPDGYPLSYSLDTKPMRQQHDGILVESGAFYASSVGAIAGSRQLLSGKIKVMVSATPYNIDIDEPTDWLLAEAIVKNNLINN